MLPRLTKLHRPAAALRAATRGYVAPAAPLAKSTVLELDAKKVGAEIRKRGLTNVVTNTRDGGMDRVSRRPGLAQAPR